MRRLLQIALSFFFLICLIGSLTVSAQTSGDITGLVTDSSGAAVVGATVSVSNKATGAVRRVTTNNEGLYTFPSLLPGDYEMKVEQQATTFNEKTKLVRRSDIAFNAGKFGKPHIISHLLKLRITKELKIL